MDNKYKNSKIYTIRYKNDNSLIYVGSTVQPLYKRFAMHKVHSKDPKNENILFKHYNYIKERDKPKNILYRSQEAGGTSNIRPKNWPDKECEG